MIKSSKSRKQREFQRTAPLHIKQKFMSAHLSKELRKKYKKRSYKLRKGDEVKVVRGKHKKFVGKINKINLKKTRVYIEDLKRRKVSGEEVLIPIHPSNLIIQNLDISDTKRQKAIKRKKVNE